MKKIWIFIFFSFLGIISESAFAQKQWNYCVTRSRGLIFRVQRGEAADIKAEAFTRCLRNRQTRDTECDNNLRCDEEPTGVTPPAAQSVMPPAANPSPQPIAPAPANPRHTNQILLCEIDGVRSSGPNQEAITSYLVDVCKRRRELVSCYSSLRCNDELVYKFIRRCELRGSGFIISAFGIEDRHARLVIAQTCRNQPGASSDCNFEPACTSVPNRPGMDLATRTEGSRRTNPGAGPGAPAGVQPPLANPPVVAPTAPTTPVPVAVPARPDAGGDVIVTPKTPVYRGTEPQPEIPPNIGPFR